MTMTTPTTTTTHSRSPVLGAFLAVLAAGVLTQAALAGLFLSLNPSVQFVHMLVGSALPWIAIIPTVIAWVRVGQRAIPASFGVLVTLLTLGFWAQDALGHMAFPATIAVHVPLGVVLFGASTALAIAAFRGGRPNERVRD
ncbi:hypothetical protein [Microbacterium sp.]|uniref:hypothetical protein n=1 Tax=Microbacterium sp. TaxID=51671 RepID=UPI002C4F2827|nr:hypothetical protein [Microbacterium sp.]HWL77764.1 hypothetical protein [Microbacterium sp.]